MNIKIELCSEIIRDIAATTPSLVAKQIQKAAQMVIEAIDRGQKGGAIDITYTLRDGKISVFIVENEDNG
jgi:methylglyoxal synthase